MAVYTYMGDGIHRNPTALANVLQPLVTLGYGDAWTANSMGIILQKDGNTIMSVTLTAAAGGGGYYSYHTEITIARYNDNGVSLGDIISYSPANTYYETGVYTTSHGAYVAMLDSRGYFISKTNNDKVGILALGFNTSPSTSSTVIPRLKTVSACTNDNTSFDANFTFPTTLLRNQMSLMNVPTPGNNDMVSYFPHIYYTLTSQLNYSNNSSTPPTNIFLNGYRYLWVGNFLLRDDPPVDS